MSTRRDTLSTAWAAERSLADLARRCGEHAEEWFHLQRAHVLSQPFAGLHVQTHVAMLRSAIRRRDAQETVGQLVRLVGAGPASLTGRYPLGNTGGSDVSALRPMPIPDDLRVIFDRADEHEAST